LPPEIIVTIPPWDAIFSLVMPSVKSQSRVPVARRGRAVFLPAIELDRASTTPLYHQLATQFGAAVARDGRAGDRLPSTRLLARMLGLSRNTVVTAYETLVADGAIEGKVGSRMVIADRRIAGAALQRFDPLRVMRDAMYPARTIAIADPDGAAIYLVY
jgi:DNA-binding transcriptional regulator YhcF (GntR family)